MLAHDVLAETRTILYAQYSANCTGGSADSASHHRAERASGTSTGFGAFLCAAYSSLGLRSER
jgi:hypothetical protein